MVGLNFPPGKIHVCLSNRLISIAGIEQSFAGSLICKDELAPRIFCPYKIRQIVAHQPDHRIQVLVLTLALAYCILGSFSLCDVFMCQDNVPHNPVSILDRVNPGSQPARTTLITDLFRIILKIRDRLRFTRECLLEIGQDAYLLA